MGLAPGSYKLGDMDISIHDNRATLTGTETLAGRCVPAPAPARSRALTVARAASSPWTSLCGDIANTPVRQGAARAARW